MEADASVPKLGLQLLMLAVYLEGQRDLLNRLKTPITHMVTVLIPIINLLSPPKPYAKMIWSFPFAFPLLLSPPDPPSRV